MGNKTLFEAQPVTAMRHSEELLKEMRRLGASDELLSAVTGKRPPKRPRLTGVRPRKFSRLPEVVPPRTGPRDITDVQANPERWYREASEAGSGDAAFNLALLLEARGRFVEAEE